MHAHIFFFKKKKKKKKARVEEIEDDDEHVWLRNWQDERVCLDKRLVFDFAQDAMKGMTEGSKVEFFDEKQQEWSTKTITVECILDGMCALSSETEGQGYAVTELRLPVAKDTKQSVFYPMKERSEEKKEAKQIPLQTEAEKQREKEKELVERIQSTRVNSLVIFPQAYKQLTIQLQNLKHCSFDVLYRQVFANIPSPDEQSEIYLPGVFFFFNYIY
ncbi:hypothetical protein RFI_35247, partial [Reticulomyxa filosa]